MTELAASIADRVLIKALLQMMLCQISHTFAEHCFLISSECSYGSALYKINHSNKCILWQLARKLVLYARKNCTHFYPVLMHLATAILKVVRVQVSNKRLSFSLFSSTSYTSRELEKYFEARNSQSVQHKSILHVVHCILPSAQLFKVPAFPSVWWSSPSSSHRRSLSASVALSFNDTVVARRNTRFFNEEEYFPSPTV